MARLVPTPLLAAALALFGGSARADEEPAGTVYAEEVVVVFARGETPVEKAPAAVSVLSAEELTLARSASSFPDLLAAVPGVMVQKTARGFGSPYLRGFTGYRTLTLIDGIRLNNSTYRDGPNQYAGTVDLFDLERVEVERGPGSVLHGSDAVGGTVRLVPRLARPGETGAGTVRALVRGASEERSGAGHLSFESGGQGLAALAGLTYRNLGDLSAGRGTGLQRGSGFDEAGWNANASADLGEARLTLAAQQYTQREVPRWHRTTASPGWHGTSPGTDLSNTFDQDRFLGYARLTADPVQALLDRATLTLSYQRQTEENDRVAGTAARTVQGFAVDTLGADLQLDAPAGPHHLTFGVEGYLDLVESQRTSFPAGGGPPSAAIQGPIGDDARYWTLGVYLRDRWKVREALEVVAGLRLDTAAAAAHRVADPVGGGVLSLDQAWWALAGDLRAIVEIAPEVRVYGAVSQSFRTPSLADLTTFDLAEQGQVEVPALGLEPERFLSAELGLRGGGRVLGGQVALFRTDIRNMIDRYFSGETVVLPSGQPAAVVRKANVSRGAVVGLELEASLRPHPDLRLAGQLTWTRGDADTTVVEGGSSRLVSGPLSRVAPPTGALRLRWGPATRWAEVEVLWAGTQDRLSRKDLQDTTRIPPGGTPGYTVVSLRGGLRLRPGTDLVAVVRNLSDADYRIHGSGLNEPGFGVELAARVAVGP